MGVKNHAELRRRYASHYWVAAGRAADGPQGTRDSRPAAPHGGFASFNEHFHREIKIETRQLAGQGDPKVIVSANDGTVYRIARKVQGTAPFWTKDSPNFIKNCHSYPSLEVRNRA